MRRSTEPSAAASDGRELGQIFLGGTRVDCEFVPATTLTADMVLAGPTVVEDMTSTTIVPPRWVGAVHETGSLVLERPR